MSDKVPTTPSHWLQLRDRSYRPLPPSCISLKGLEWAGPTGGYMLFQLEELLRALEGRSKSGRPDTSRTMLVAGQTTGQDSPLLGLLGLLRLSVGSGARAVLPVSPQHSTGHRAFPLRSLDPAVMALGFPPSKPAKVTLRSPPTGSLETMPHSWTPYWPLDTYGPFWSHTCPVCGRARAEGWADPGFPGISPNRRLPCWCHWDGCLGHHRFVLSL